MVLLNKKELKIFLTFFIIYLCFARFEPWNDPAKLDLTRAMVDEHRFEIDSYINDTGDYISNTGDRAYYNDHYYSDKPPGASFLTVPVYAVFKLFFGMPDTDFKLLFLEFIIVAFSSALFSALLVVLMYKISRFFLKKEIDRILITIIFGLGTGIFIYSTIYYQYGISIFFAFLCFYLIFKMKQENKFSNKNFFIAGLCGGFAIICEYSASIIILACIIMILTLKKWKQLILFLFGFSITISLLFMYNYSIFGNILDTSYNHMDSKIVSEILTDYRHGLIPPHFIKTDFMPFFSLAKFKIILRLLFYPFRGLFFYSPILALSLVGLFYMYKKHKLELTLISFIFILFLIYNSQIWDWGAGSSFGPRYLYAVVPFLTLSLMFCFKKINLKFILLLTVISIIINLMGMQVLTNEQHAGGLPMRFTSNYETRLATWQPISNPLFTYYMPLFFRYGPRSILIEEILGFGLPPFFNVIVLLIIVSFIWRKELIRKIKRDFKITVEP